VTVDRPLRVLHLEDDITNSALTAETLEAGGFSCRVTRVETQAAFTVALERESFDRCGRACAQGALGSASPS
jgi:hypothetical protein